MNLSSAALSSLTVYGDSSDDSNADDDVDDIVDGVDDMTLLSPSLRVCQVMNQLADSIKRLQCANAFPYNPAPLLKLIQQSNYIG